MDIKDALLFKNHKRKGLTLLLLAALIFNFNPASAQKFKALLSGNNEVHMPMTTANGEVWARLDGNMLMVWGSFSNLQGDFDANIAGGSHVHMGYQGQNGGVELMLTPSLSNDLRSGTYDSTDNTFNLSNEQVTALKNRMLYVNIHTEFSAAGEIRGQFVPAEAMVYQAFAFGSNQMHHVQSAAMGSFIIDVVNNEATVTGAFSGLQSEIDESIAGGIHLHNAMAGENGGVSIVLDPTLDNNKMGGVLQAADNTYTLTTMQTEALMNRNMYVNIHSLNQQMGEIRGQVMPNSQIIYRSFLSGINQNPTVTERSSGMIVIEYWNDTMAISGSFSGLSSAVDTSIFGGAHIHMAYAGSNGGVEFLVDVDYDQDLMGGKIMASKNMFALTSAQKTALWERMLYLNIHTLKHASGELRGQLLPMANYYFYADLTGAQENHNVLTPASGKTIIEVKGNQVSLSGSFMNLKDEFDASVAGGSHLHNGLAGTNGGIAVELEASTEMDNLSGVYEVNNNTWQVSNGLLDSMKAGWHYLNLHTKAFAAGELRGQVMPEANAYLFSKISGASEAPAVNSTGMGAAIVAVKSNWLALNGSFSGLTAEFDPTVAGGAHIHKGIPGKNGGIWAPLTATTASDKMSGTFEMKDNEWMLSDGAIDSMLMRFAYINIHTMAHASGEIRGQILNMAQAYFTTSLLPINQPHQVMSNAMGALKIELNGMQATAIGSFSGLESKVATSIAGGAHIHKAKNGMSGDVLSLLNLDLESDMMSGVIMADSNMMMVDEDFWMNLENNELYVNLHSENYNAGVLRGQIQQDINHFPNMDAEMTMPSNGSMITIEGNGDNTLDFEWEMATDNDMDDLTYIFQLSDEMDFSNVVYWAFTSADNMASLNYNWLDSALAAWGIENNENLKLYYRAVTLDGSEHSASAASEITLTRGTITGINNPMPAGSFSSSVYPSVTNNVVNIEFEKPLEGKTSVRIYSTNGKLMLSQEFDIADKNIQLNVSNFAEGQYFIMIKNYDRISSHKIIVNQ
jgi:hypothetical protein